MFSFIRELITRARLQKQIKKKNEELKKINDELDHFVYATSHELRSPLTSILGILNLMEKDVNGINTIKHIEIIRTGINRVDFFVKRVLDYSRNNRASINIELINFEATIDSVIETYKVDNKEILFLKDVHEWHPFYSDPKRVRQIFENLVSNAVKYSTVLDKPPFISINVNTKMDRVIIVIRDNGIGIALEHQKKIFEMFYRVSSEKPGTGMGLYLVKELVEKLKGNIELESELQKGSKFSITLQNLRNERAK